MSHRRNNDPVSQGQFEAQGQLQGQAELQGQLQGQLELQDQKQDQDQDQKQDQDQGQHQDQSQYAYQAVGTEVWNANANGNLNGNGNLNFNENDNKIDNEVDNKVDNEVDNEVDNKIENRVETDVDTDVDVDVKVDLDIDGDLWDPSDNDAIDIDELDIEELEGSFFLMPDSVSQALNDGNIFNIDQVNNLVDNDKVDSASVDYSGGGGLPTLNGFGGYGGGGFDMKVEGGDAKIDGDMEGVGEAVADASVAAEAFTQNIVLGANIQYNTLNLHIGNGDGDVFDA